MTKRAQLREHISTLDKISTTLTAMRNLSLIEINKVKKTMPNQKKLSETMKEVGNDFLSFHPDFFSQFQIQAPIVSILIGSERGFCGRFNKAITEQLEARTLSSSKEKTHLIVVGKKLATKLIEKENIFQVLEGPSTVEEIPEVIFNLVSTIEQLSIKLGANLNPGCWEIFYNRMETHVLETAGLRLLWEFKEASRVDYAIEPLLTTTPENFLLEYINQYVFSALNAVFYQSFFAEQQQRFSHLEGALDQLTKNIATLTHKLKKLRREEITQEIQIIMLSAETMIKELQNKGY